MAALSIDPRIALVGLVVGILVGLSGVGGGSLVTPLLVLALGIKPAVAVGTDLLYSVPTKLLGAFVHHRQRTVNWRLVSYLTLGGIPAAVVGLFILATLEGQLGLDAVNAGIKRGLGYMLVLAAVAIVLKPLLSRLSRASSPNDSND